jgi:hypothetical protein
MSEVRQPVIGKSVVFVDEHAVAHDALLTAIHGVAGPSTQPAVNLVYVTQDEAKTDPYGRQIERKSSVVYRMNQSAHGMYWAYQGDTF